MSGRKCSAVEAALEAIRGGMTVYQAARLYGVSSGNLYKHCWALGIPRPGKKRR